VRPDFRLADRTGAIFLKCQVDDALESEAPAGPAAVESKAAGPAGAGAGSGSARLPALPAKPKARQGLGKHKDASDQAWEAKFKEVETFIAEHPGERTPNPSMGKKGPLTTWLVNNRGRIKQGTETSPTRIRRFQELDAKYQKSVKR
jgi:hypothetical protein